MRVIKLYKVSSFKYSPFGDFEPGDISCLNENKIEITTNSNDAEIIISENFKFLVKYFWRRFLGAKFLIWTNEPRFDLSFQSQKSFLFGLFKVNVMNIYTGDVFVSNLTFHAKMMNRRLDILSDSFRLKTRNTVALMSYYKGVNSDELMWKDKNIDLIALRSQIALLGFQLGKLDVYGKGWPAGISKEDSREGNWPDRKKELLENYQFNLCFENTLAPNYMTEKIWGSIENYCLPIYYGKHTNAYGIFPKDSFIDYSDFNSPHELFLFIENMPDETYVKRMNKCIEVYNSINDKGDAFALEERKKMLDKIIDKIRLLTN
jgi:hypothetical protein